ncbi:M17 family metallopeptidase [Mailhella massiliensis]|uniref:Probable cytosol aminopeptidase n=1 Tax=Mailhella massiliensis TaxID=1903261 RepID=A0A921DRI6_9BACT|nr:leucyl aminopeptidase [Mailhella massiliensis]HJD96047.1 leucyl aminopeptidase [Mailhella massiliensis]
MDIRFQAGGPSRWKADVALSFVFEGEKAEQTCPELAERAPWLGIAPAWRDFRGRKGEMTMFYGPGAMEISRVLGVGLGKGDKLDMTAFRHAVGSALHRCREYDLETVGVDGTSLARVAARLGVDFAFLVRETVLSAFLGLYRYERWLSKKSEHADPRWLAFLLEGEFVEDAVRTSARMAEAEAAGITLARDAVNDPANVMTPSVFAEKAREVASRYGMAFRVLGPEELAAEGMAAYLAVAQGSAEAPRMAVVEYTPAGAEGRAPVILVGKGLCFDSGGISLKPAKGMEDMKGDMSGAAAVLGVMEALGRLDASHAPARPVVGIMACTENMPGGHATRPGDIVVAKNGKSIEIVNTDAEGRLVLADALAWAQEHYRPFRMLDIATLTGACAVALGLGTAGVFSGDDVFAGELCTAGEKLGERSWRLPLWTATSLEALKSPCADMVNSGPREGGAIHAAVFLQQFIREGVTWAHIDMAAADMGESPINAKGATGFGVRTLLSVVLSAGRMLQ